MISCLVKHNCVYRSTKRDNKYNNSDKTASFRNSHTKFNNNSSNSYEIEPKTYNMKDLVALS